jgi:hypothetical protein
MSCGQKDFKLGWRYHHLLSGFLANDHFLRVSHQSLLIMMRYQGLCTDLLEITLGGTHKLRHTLRGEAVDEV